MYNILGEMYPFLRELSFSMLWVLTGFIFDNLHPFSSITLFMTVFGNHVQLTDTILQQNI